MAWLGRKQLGESILLSVQCAPGNTRVPTAPTSAPTFRVYSEAGTNVLNGSLPPMERYTATGLFQFMQRLASAFSAGRYYVRTQFTISAVNYVQIDAFQVVAGGSSSGTIISLAFLDRPDQQDWLLAQTDSGATNIYRGPKLS